MQAEDLFLGSSICNCYLCLTSHSTQSFISLLFAARNVTDVIFVCWELNWEERLKVLFREAEVIKKNQRIKKMQIFLVENSTGRREI